MKQNRFLRNVSANTLQLMVNQLFGLIIFYALSKGLDKSSFGGLNWVLAVLLSVFSILTFGIDQLMVKKIASGHDRISVFSAYLFHVLFTGGIFYVLIFIQYLLFPNFIPRQDLLLLIGIGKLMLFLSTPFKQVAIAVERFGSLLYMSVISNLFRGTVLLFLMLFGDVTLNAVILIFILGDFAELIVCIMIARPILQPPIKIKWNKSIQFSLFKEALPQAGVITFNAIMARFDWILIGMLVSSIKLAEYSFAWKLFEVSTLPLFIIAPIMIPLFTRLFTADEKAVIPSFFLEWQVMFACFMALFLNVIWGVVVDPITDGKYGLVNTNTILILSLSMPLLYFNNYLWTINFAKGKLKLVFFIIATSFIVNVTGCCILIPFYQNEGAAIACLLAAIVQTFLYLYHTEFHMPGPSKLLLFIWPVAAFACGFISKQYIASPVLRIAIPMLMYIAVVAISRRVRVRDLKTLQSLYQ